LFAGECSLFFDIGICIRLYMGMLPKSMVVSFMALIMAIVEKIECSRVTLDLGLETSFMNA